MILYIGFSAHTSLSRGVYRVIRQIFWGPAQGTSQHPISSTATQILHKAPSKPLLFHHSQQGITVGHQEHKRDNVHMG